MIVLDDDYKIVKAYTRGRKEKIWFLKDDVKYLYKFGASNYEIYAELIAEKLGRQCNIDMASYRLAKFQNTVGVLSESFLKQGELIISSDKLKQSIQSIYEENNLIGDLRDNTISNLIEAAATYDLELEPQTLFIELIKRWMFYGLIMESDKNETNISFIKKKNHLILSPDYDNSTMSRMNENIKLLLMELQQTGFVQNVTDSVKQSLKPSSSSSDYFLDSFREFVGKYNGMSREIFKSFEKLDVDTAINEVEVENDIDVPWEVKWFLNKTIKSRYDDMKMIVNQPINRNKKLELFKY